ncbi:hypothetical protein, partial [Prevotella histicola]|uniref:hypothetical protein n=1 Tax=Prevotella histicola TaxID=470565 RepID=UPI00241EFDB2
VGHACPISFYKKESTATHELSPFEPKYITIYNKAFTGLFSYTKPHQTLPTPPRNILKNEINTVQHGHIRKYPYLCNTY